MLVNYLKQPKKKDETCRVELALQKYQIIDRTKDRNPKDGAL